jgi:translation initiation factor IF-1
LLPVTLSTLVCWQPHEDGNGSSQHAIEIKVKIEGRGLSNMRMNTKPAASAPRPGEDEKEAGIEVFGTVVEKFRAGMFSLQLEAGQKVLATLAGRLRRNRIKVMNGDRVSVELSPYDLSKGRITYRHK